jgi:hypothetical protein
MFRFPILKSAFYVFVFLLFSCTKEIQENKVPVAEAGTSKIITLPVISESLAGSGVDADGEIVAYLWSQVKGPSETTIINPGSAATDVKGFIEGTYVFQLMVTDDKGATGVDTTAIIVNRAPVTTLTIQPSNNLFEFQVSNWNGANQTYAGAVDIPLQAWTINSNPMTVREVIKFDLGDIPTHATIKSANLYLYSFPAPTINGNLNDANYGSNNTVIVQQIIGNWNMNTLGWFNQPATTTANQITVPSTNQPVLDLNLNVTSMVSSMVSSNANYGFLLKLQNEVAYTSRLFVSSYNTSYPAKRPKLVIVYE